jgi:hypothetical protein
MKKMCHPECRWACDDPVCLAECTSFTEPPVCTCENPLITPVCRVECPPDQCEAESCPNCVTLCDPNTACGNILCEAPVAYWACRKPRNCPLPTCELQCEQPACEYQGNEDPWKKKANSLPWSTIFLIAFIILILAIYRPIQKR